MEIAKGDAFRLAAGAEQLGGRLSRCISATGA